MATGLSCAIGNGYSGRQGDSRQVWKLHVLILERSSPVGLNQIEWKRGKISEHPQVDYTMMISRGYFVPLWLSRLN